MNWFSLTVAVVLLQCSCPVADTFVLDLIPDLLRKPKDWIQNMGANIISIPKAVLTVSKNLWKNIVKDVESDMPLMEELGTTWVYQVSEAGETRVIFMSLDSIENYNDTAFQEYSSEQESIKFWLYTRKNKRKYEELNIDNLKSKYYLKRKPLMVITHGWISNGETNATQLIKSALLKKLDVNAIIVDWRDIASMDYYVAASSVYLVGEKICELIKHMSKSKRFKLRANDVRLVGHSLGAHVMGAAGDCLRNVDFYVSRITGLDPARPFFESPPILNGIKKQDAQFVDIIHTNAGILGLFFSKGHADFYPNGGVGQPGCYDELSAAPIMCDHARSYHFYAESILYDKYESTQCLSYVFYILGVCPYTDKNLLGYKCESDAHGNYYIQTGDPDVDYVV